MVTLLFQAVWPARRVRGRDVAKEAVGHPFTVMLAPDHASAAAKVTDVTEGGTDSV
jgi:hypothetical protein